MDPYILFYERIRGKEKKDKLSQLHRLNNQSSTEPQPKTSEETASVSTTTVGFEETTVKAEPETTSMVAGCSFDFTTAPFDPTE